MAVLYVVSTEAYSGKTGICLSLGLELKERGMKIGYMKPLGTLPGTLDGKIVDLDAYSILKLLDTGDRVEDASPISLTRKFISTQFKEESVDVLGAIKEAFERVSNGKDAVIIENGSDVNEGRFLGAAAFQISELLDTKVLLIARFRSELTVDDILGAHGLLGGKVIGVILNQVPNSQRAMAEMMIQFLARKGIKTYGILPQDRTLMSVTVAEIAEHLNGTILTATERTNELVENFMVGAMGQEKALRFFQRTANKAVITGGDRADVQLAALETPTKALILTGNLQPSPIVMARAEDLGIPMILVEYDTLVAVERTDELVGRVRIHEAQKIQRLQELMRANIDVGALYNDAGVPV